MVQDDKEAPPYRCKETIDLEDILAMKKEEEKKTHVRVIVIYKSGREEELCGDLNLDGSIHKNFQKRIERFRAFPTVKDVKIIKY